MTTTLVFACHSKACAPPPIGVGGSKPGTGGGRGKQPYTKAGFVYTSDGKKVGKLYGGKGKPYYVKVKGQKIENKNKGALLREIESGKAVSMAAPKPRISANNAAASGGVDTHLVRYPSDAAGDYIKSWDVPFKLRSDAELTKARAKRDALKEAMTTAERSAHKFYINDGHLDMNGALRETPNHIRGPHIDTMNRNLKSAIERLGESAPAQLFRAAVFMDVNLSILNMKPGDIYEDPAFGSWTTDKDTLLTFANTGAFDGVSKERVLFKLDTKKGAKALAGSHTEFESILPPGIKFKVKKVTLFKATPDSDLSDNLKITNRIIELEMV